MKVIKFGGSSVANAASILKVENIIKNESAASAAVVVVSALSGVTDALIQASELAAAKDERYLSLLKKLEERHLQLVQDLLPVYGQSSLLSKVKKQFNDLEDLCGSLFVLGEFSLRIKDRIASFGEMLSSMIIAERLKSEGMDVAWMNASSYIRTDSAFTQAKVFFDETNAAIRQYFGENKHRITLVPGFVARDSKGDVTTLGRGGSDYSAAIIAAAVQAEELQIWTDVSGMMTADPRLVSNAKVIPEISYSEAMELSHFGAKVLYPPTIQPAMNQDIDIRIKNTFEPQAAGTLISGKENSDENRLAAGISNMNSVALLTLEGSGMIGIPGVAARFFDHLSQKQINVILITQSSSEHSITIAISEKDIPQAEEAINTAFRDDIILKRIRPVNVEAGLSIVAVIGENMKNRSGVSARLFSALGSNGISMRAIAQGSSEKNISVVIAADDARKAVNVLHERFFEDEIRKIHVYICGLGNVGSRLIDQIFSQNGYLRKNLLMELKISGISNSRKMLFSDSGISRHDFENLDDLGEMASASRFSDEIIRRNARNSVFVDVTASPDIVLVYEKLLQKSISIVACNKIAAAAEYSFYSLLKNSAKAHNCRFYFETNVGAGLPVIGTMNDLMRSGDSVEEIQAVLSGTLNFVFNHYDGTRPFAEVVKQAQDEGYTEPDPRLDLAGTDVARKILILAREAGYNLEFGEVNNHAFLPEKCMEGSVEDFYRSLLEYESHFLKLYQDASESGKRLKYVAEFRNGKASVGLQQIAPGSDLYHLYGKDNIVILKTLRYSEQPLVIKGAGAGADVTASGVFADIVRAV